MKRFYDEYQTRYTLISNRAGADLNWLFFPGGPGCDTSYFIDLVELLALPGNVWLIDMPGNGDNRVGEYDFERWLSIFLPILKGFKNPVVVGHSFGAMLPMLFKECEDLLAGFVILNSAPSMWMEEFGEAEQPTSDIAIKMQRFIKHPDQETFDAALQACTPYYFPAHSLERGKALLAKAIVAFEPAVWWQRRVIKHAYQANWVPEAVKTLIVGAEFDLITPFSLFEQDMRFNRSNIEKVCIPGAGHLPWIEQPEAVKQAFQGFLTKHVA